MATLKLTSPAFANNQMIPQKYSCKGEDINPPLKIEGVPKNTKSLLLIVDDPDAPVGNWNHWIVWNIPPETSVIGENSVPQNAVLGMNDFRKLDYGGPCPPSGTHRYFFKICKSSLKKFTFSKSSIILHLRTLKRMLLIRLQPYNFCP